MENQDKQDEIRAKQAISPAGLGDQSIEGNSGVGAEIDAPELPTNEMEDTYMNGDEPAENVPMTHPNRNEGGKPDIDKPAYS
ncbi:hypothetical protein [Fibrivirga algicola]|uniref:Uncharacterized protein n=1 Tax=Fibrivirga algicola TaxID=2950420 RepID=A0ABX0QH68_9BACT|nr:hypothetical protein [Fibrivirga algicola]ARK10284.1 hypothetical protein A6C57_08050 [Fibrella sp. ES10-3-2-2]NID11786.1 hypothetical protein [Fibrivirga algicola]